MPLVFSSCSKDDDENYTTSDIVGNWKLEKCVAAEVKTNNDALTKAISKDIEIEEDSNIYSFTSDGKYKENDKEVGTFTVNGNKITTTYKVENESNTISISGNKLILYVDYTEYYKEYIDDFIDGGSNVTISKVTIAFHYVKLNM